jgi:hypothetical protein
MLAYQPVIDSATTNFVSFLNVFGEVDSARVFIAGSGADAILTASFNAVIERVEDFMNGLSIDYLLIPGFLADLEQATILVNAILDAGEFSDSLATLDDSRLADAMDVAIADAKAVLAEADSSASGYGTSVSILSQIEEILSEVMVAKDLIETTVDFDEAKQDLEDDIDIALAAAGTSGISLQDAINAFKQLQADIKTFRKALEAGDTPVILSNPGFEQQLDFWSSVSDDSGIPYLQNNGVDGSVNMAMWKGTDYHVKAFQSLSGLPNGTYQVIMMAVVSEADRISLYAESNGTVSETPLSFDSWEYTRRVIEINVTNGNLVFGVKGSGTDNLIPANVWGIFDDFEVKWLSTVDIANPGFENLLEGWTSISDTDWIPYTQDDGVEGSKNMAYWNSVDYHVSTFQTVSVPNGTYQVTVWAKISQADFISLFAVSGNDTTSLPLPFGDAAYAKSSMNVRVTDGTLKFGVKGSGPGDMIPANVWGTFDNFEVLRLPDIPVVNPGFEEDFTGWTKDSDTDWMPYIEQKGVDGSKSVTYWQGVDHHVSTFQMVSNLFNGEYDISAMTFTPNDSSYMLFGESGGVQKGTYILSSGGLEKNKVTASVADQTLTFGIRGSGEANLVPANHWIVFDNFEVIMKSIIPVYNPVKGADASKGSAVSIPDEVTLTNNVVWWEEFNHLVVRSDDPIRKMKVYSLSGSLISTVDPNNQVVRLPLGSGFYVIQVETENGFNSLHKVILRY